ncbi:hypothetical protein RHMOL_Rhmol12G0116700 [Rhododendron molle]|uniref:Uncharacterized protein n=10 Tax=Rhododendron molle TaxID=49168 RepID=A0ACC0LHH2_RHOML|nr:hypothetical protein RHMOL_Rhmol12G0116700 [Rhododendron molle]KAI8527980.1 hypothetical protein RHMOL_Rhmol12G0116700 [Rhododendron molle]KAI8527981.1 hypothetical protein RHMOL_Rhmol12G0116700 [Rhododendron molle]KAI8527982.1 hypothetical protein RHMOL_Rhmol12G0116700 [Rhododendron molle]KAI8527983.1 hypothetical protein RHMOL_Rhmol12G0116700 [Rhododendron molle]
MLVYKHIALIGGDEDVFMPTDHKNIFEVQNPNTWILLKAEPKVWPVHVINNRMELWKKAGMSFTITLTWKKDLGLSSGYNKRGFLKLLYWTKTYSDFNGILDQIKTAWLPSVLLADAYPLQFAYVCTPQVSFSQVFAHRFKSFFHHQTIAEIVFSMNNFEWNVPRQNGRLQPIGIQNRLRLQDSDLVFVAVKDPSDIRLLVLSSYGYDRMRTSGFSI